MQNMSEHVYYSEPQRILYRLLDSTHITQTIVGNTLVTEQSQHSSEFVSKRKTKISANGLIYNNLHGNQCNNFHIPNILDFLWNSNSEKHPIPNFPTFFSPTYSDNSPVRRQTGRTTSKLVLSWRCTQRS